MQHGPLIQAVATLAPFLQSGIQVGETNFGKESEKPEIHAEDGRTHGGKNARRCQQRAIAAQHNDQRRRPRGQLCASDRGSSRGVIPAFKVQHRVVAVLAQPRDQLRQKPRKFFPVRLRNNGDRGHASKCNGSGRQLTPLAPFAPLTPLRIQQKLAVAFRAGDRRRNRLDHFPVLRSHALCDLADRELVCGRVANDASFAHMLAPGFELRFH